MNRFCLWSGACWMKFMMVPSVLTQQQQILQRARIEDKVGGKNVFQLFKFKTITSPPNKSIEGQSKINIMVSAWGQKIMAANYYFGLQCLPNRIDQSISILLVSWAYAGDCLFTFLSVLPHIIKIRSEMYRFFWCLLVLFTGDHAALSDSDPFCTEM